MQSTSPRRTLLRTGLALALTMAVAGAGTAVAAESASAAGGSSKLERIAAKGGKKAKKPSKKSMAAVKRQLERAGLQTSDAPGGAKKMRRGLCDIYYYADAAVGLCLNVGGPTGFYTNVFVDWYTDRTGWIYYGWVYS